MISITDSEFSKLTKFVKQKYGIDLSKKRVLIEGRLSNTLHQRGISSFQEYLDILLKDTSGTEITQMLNKLTTNYSFFMRETEHFEFMKNVVLPELEQRHQHDHDLRIWSAGCSTGQEPYTMAMVIDEYFGPRKGQWDATILATDISMRVLTQAKTGTYNAESLNEIPERWRKKYVHTTPEGSVQINDNIRNQVVFKPLNLMESFSFKKPFDLIFCRNVMIYFDEQTKNNLVSKYYHCMAKGGYLFIGHSEVINKEVTHFSYVKPAIYQKRG